MRSNRCAGADNHIVREVGLQVPLNIFAVVAIERKHLLYALLEDGEIDAVGRDRPCNNIPRNDLISAGVQHLAVVCLLRQEVRHNFVIGQLRLVKVHDEFVLQLLQLHILLQVLE